MTKDIVNRSKTPQYDFRYDDTDTLMNELEEFYPYVEMADIARNPERFKGSFNGGKWISQNPYTSDVSKPS